MSGNKKKTIIILISVLVCLSVIVAIIIGVTKNTPADNNINNDTTDNITELVSEENSDNSSDNSTEATETVTENLDENTTEVESESETEILETEVLETEKETEPETEDSDFVVLNDGEYVLDKREPLAHAPNVYVNWSGEDPETVYDIYYVEWRCTQDADETYWAVHNWESGYAGFQTNMDGEKKILLSLWNLNDGTEDAIEPEIEYYSSDDGIGRFDNEGSGAQVFTPYNWKVGVWYSMKIEITYKDNKTYFTQFVREENEEWEKTACISYPVHFEPKGATHMFQEDYWFNCCERSCELRNARGRIKDTKEWEDWNTATIESTYIPYHDDTCWIWNINFNCNYEVKGNTIKVFSGGKMYKKYNVEFPNTVYLK